MFKHNKNTISLFCVWTSFFITKHNSCDISALSDFHCHRRDKTKPTFVFLFANSGIKTKPNTEVFFLFVICESKIIGNITYKCYLLVL